MSTSDASVGASVLRDDDVVGLEVSMEHACGGAGVDPGADLLHDREHLANRQPPGARETMGEVTATTAEPRR